MLSKEDFATVVKSSPIISVDFIVKNLDGKFLLGLRNNNPAKNYYFTLGGIIRKNEKIEDAIKRISLNEFNFEISKQNLIFNGVFEHFYQENFFDNYDFSTHYVVLSYIFHDVNSNIITSKELKNDDKYLNQHNDFIWLSKEEIIENKMVHPNVLEMIEHI